MIVGQTLFGPASYTPCITCNRCATIPDPCGR